jgi:hypothetical protein
VGVRTSATCFIDLRPWPGQASVEAPGLSLSHRLPTLVVWLSFGMRGPGVDQGGERLKRGAMIVNASTQYSRKCRKINSVHERPGGLVRAYRLPRLDSLAAVPRQDPTTGIRLCSSPVARPIRLRTVTRPTVVGRDLGGCSPTGAGDAPARG